MVVVERTDRGWLRGRASVITVARMQTVEESNGGQVEGDAVARMQTVEEYGRVQAEGDAVVSMQTVERYDGVRVDVEERL